MTARQAGPGSAAQTLVAALDRLGRGLRTHRQAVAGELGLTPLQAEILLVLADAPPPEPVVTALAAELGVRQPTASESVAALVRKGLVDRTPAPDDRRVTTLALTVDGREVAVAVSAADDVLVDAAATLPAGVQGAAVHALLELIGAMLDRGVIDVARACTTCRFYRRVADGAACELLQVPLTARTLRVDCPDHQPRATA